jgi:invasion protein IalB
MALDGATAQSAKKTAPAPPAPPPAAASTATRTEILTYDNWTVTCRDGQTAKDPRSCIGELVIFQDVQGGRRPVFSWILGLNKESQIVSALRFPPGVMIAPGVEMKSSDKVTKALPITSCEPAVCEAVHSVDEAFIRSVSAAPQVDVNIQATDGRVVTFTVYPKGFDQAVAAIRK